MEQEITQANRKVIYDGKNTSHKLLILIACMVEFEKGQKTIENYISGKPCSDKWLRFIDNAIVSSSDELKDMIRKNLN